MDWFLNFLFGHAMRFAGSQLDRREIELQPLQWKSRDLTTGPTGKPLVSELIQIPSGCLT